MPHTDSYKSIRSSLYRSSSQFNEADDANQPSSYTYVNQPSFLCKNNSQIATFGGFIGCTTKYQAAKNKIHRIKIIMFTITIFFIIAFEILYFVVGLHLVSTWCLMIVAGILISTILNLSINLKCQYLEKSTQEHATKQMQLASIIQYIIVSFITTLILYASAIPTLLCIAPAIYIMLDSILSIYITYLIKKLKL